LAAPPLKNSSSVSAVMSTPSWANSSPSAIPPPRASRRRVNRLKPACSATMASIGAQRQRDVEQRPGRGDERRASPATANQRISTRRRSGSTPFSNLAGTGFIMSFFRGDSSRTASRPVRQFVARGRNSFCRSAFPFSCCGDMPHLRAPVFR
jgi:hypothetical protein